jgi:hypothetical protein
VGYSNGLVIPPKGEAAPVTSGEPDAKYVYSSLITNVRFICLTDVMNIL